jgi:hypothetical protein
MHSVMPVTESWVSPLGFGHARPPLSALRSGDVVWLKGNAYKKFAPSHSQGAASAGFQPWSPSIVRFGYWGTDVHGTIRRQRKQKTDAAFLAAYLIVIATAAIVTLIHPKPELMPLLLWHAGHPL